MSFEEKILAELQSINRRMARIEKQQPEAKKKETWVRYAFIKELTGWDNKAMEKARIQKLVTYKRENGIWYLLESLNPLFIIKK